MEVTEPTPHTQGTGESPMKNYATDESWPQNLKNPRGSTKREEEGEKISLELGILFGFFFWSPFYASSEQTAGHCQHAGSHVYLVPWDFKQGRDD